MRNTEERDDRPEIALSTPLGDVKVKFTGINGSEGYTATVTVPEPGLKWRGTSCIGRILMHADRGEWRVRWNYGNDLRIVGQDDKRPGGKTTDAMREAVADALNAQARDNPREQTVAMALGDAHNLTREAGRLQREIDELARERSRIIDLRDAARAGRLRPLRVDARGYPVNNQ